MNKNKEKTFSKLEMQWATYFDVLGIEYMYKPTEYSLLGGAVYSPTFYLPDYVCFADVSEGYQKSKKIIQAEKFMVNICLPLIILNDSPSLKHYEYLIPTVEDGKDEYTVKMINVVQAPNNSKSKFILEKYLKGEAQYRKYGLTKAIQAVKTANNLK